MVHGNVILHHNGYISDGFHLFNGDVSHTHDPVTYTRVVSHSHSDHSDTHDHHDYHNEDTQPHASIIHHEWTDVKKKK